MSFDENDAKLLTKLGFTKTQAKLYLTLLMLNETDANILGKRTNIPRTAVYRVLDELQEKGLVEKVIASPCKFKATPLKLGLQILVSKRAQQLAQIQEETINLLQKVQILHEQQTPEQDYKVIVIEGKERIIQKNKLAHDSVRKSIDILTTLSRWQLFVNHFYESYERALEKGVKYRVLLEKPEFETNFEKDIITLKEKPNFELRFSRDPLKTNLATFDQKEATFNFYPSKTIAESPIIWTNHPSFLSMGQDHFRNIWKTATKFEGIGPRK